jgi:hypothetical protein
METRKEQCCKSKEKRRSLQDSKKPLNGSLTRFLTPLFARLMQNESVASNIDQDGSCLLSRSQRDVSDTPIVERALQHLDLHHLRSLQLPRNLVHRLRRRPLLTDPHRWLLQAQLTLHPILRLGRNHVSSRSSSPWLNELHPNSTMELPKI